MQDTGLILFCVFIVLDFVSVNKDAKKNEPSHLDLYAYVRCGHKWEYPCPRPSLEMSVGACVIFEDLILGIVVHIDVILHLC